MAPAAIAKTLSYALIQARPDEQYGVGADGRVVLAVATKQWEADVFAVSMALELVTTYDASRFRSMCQGPKDRGQEPES